MSGQSRWSTHIRVPVQRMSLVHLTCKPERERMRSAYLDGYHTCKLAARKQRTAGLRRQPVYVRERTAWDGAYNGTQYGVHAWHKGTCCASNEDAPASDLILGADGDLVLPLLRPGSLCLPHAWLPKSLHPKQQDTGRQPVRAASGQPKRAWAKQSRSSCPPQGSPSGPSQAPKHHPWSVAALPLTSGFGLNFFSPSVAPRSLVARRVPA